MLQKAVHNKRKNKTAKNVNLSHINVIWEDPALEVMRD